MSQKIVYPPLRLLQQISVVYPRVWDQMKYFHDTNGEGGLSWNNMCYAPISAALACVTNGADIERLSANDIRLASHVAPIVAALASWRLDKQVFVLDEEMEHLLCEDTGDIEIPTEIFMQLPYLCFYVDVNTLVHNQRRVTGFFVHFEDDPINKDRELRILLLFDDGDVEALPIHIDEDTVYDSLIHTMKEAEKVLRNIGSDVRFDYDDDFFETEQFKIAVKCLQIILYICAQNADIQQDPEQKTISRPSQTIRDKYSEIKKWDVGFRIGEAFKKYRREHPDDKDEIDDQETPNEQKTHASPRPHMRRAHWHHFWTGKLSEPTKRKLVLKWLPPIPVGIQDGEVNPVVVHIFTNE